MANNITLLIIKNEGAETNFSHEFSVGLNYMNSDFEFTIQNGEFQIKELNGSAIYPITWDDITLRDDSSGSTGTPYTATSPIDLYNKLDTLGYTPFINVGGSITGLIEAGLNVTITGTGTVADPYIINASTTGSATYISGGTDISVTGDGSVGNPYVISYTGSGGASSLQEMYDDAPTNLDVTDAGKTTKIRPDYVETNRVDIFDPVNDAVGTKLESADTSLMINNAFNSSHVQLSPSNAAIGTRKTDDSGWILSPQPSGHTGYISIKVPATTSPTDAMNMPRNVKIGATSYTADVNGEIDLSAVIPDPSDFVPYTGATDDINIGDHTITATDGDSTTVYSKDGIESTATSGFFALKHDTADGEIILGMDNADSSNAGMKTGGGAAFVKVHATSAAEMTATADADNTRIFMNSPADTGFTNIIQDADRLSITADVDGGGGTDNKSTAIHFPDISDYSGDANYVQTVQARNGVVANLDQIPAAYTDEQAQDAVGAMVDTTLVYTDATPALGRAAISGDVTIAAGSNTAAITAGAIVDADINESAAIAGTKLANTPAGNISATTVQGAINELDTEKMAGAASSTDNAIARFDGTTGKVIQNSPASIDDDGGLTLAGQASPTHSAGKLVYDTTNDCFTAYNSDSAVALQIGQEQWIRVRNVTGSTIANGAAVYINGTSANVPTIALAQANSGTTTVVAGLTTESIANNAFGFVTSLGLVRGLNTSSFSVGAVYLSSSVAGGLTQTIPTAPNYRMRIGFVTNVNASTGTIHVTPSTAALGNGTVGQVLGIGANGSQEFFSAPRTVAKSAVNTTAVTGVITEQITVAITIPANTFAVGDIMQYSCAFRKVGVAGTCTLKAYINTSAAIPAGTQQIAQFGITGSNIAGSLSRNTNAVQSGNLLDVFSPTQNTALDEAAVSVIARSTVTFDPTVTNYLVITAQNTNSADSTRLANYTVTRV